MILDTRSEAMHLGVACGTMRLRIGRSRDDGVALAGGDVGAETLRVRLGRIRVGLDEGKGRHLEVGASNLALTWRGVQASLIP